MSYRAGIGHGLGAVLGAGASAPHIKCDKCGDVHGVTNKHGMPYRWFLANRPPPKWITLYQGDKREDRCPRCQDTGTKLTSITIDELARSTERGEG